MNFLRKILFFTLILASLSCSQKNKEPENSTKTTKSKKAENNSGTTIPSFSKFIVTPPPPQIGGDKTISFSVTDQVPLKDVLIELGRVAKIDVDLDPGISGGVVINAKNRPLKEVIDRIATLGKLRYHYENGILYFERDLPYAKNYFVDFLSGSKLWGDVESNISAILSDDSSNSNNTAANDPNAISPSTSGTSRYNSNKSAGIIAVYANRAQHEQIAKYLDDVYKSSSAQVLIEAKVVEVTLSKEFDTGIDWSWRDAGRSVSTSFGAFGSGSEGSKDGSISAVFPKVKFFGLGGNINANLKFLEQFGKTKSVSSPRVSAINNQKATLDFSQKYVYFTVSATAAQNIAAGTNNNNSGSSVVNSTITATKNEVDLGTKLEITPSINIKTQEITLEIKPKLSVHSGDADDPSVNPIDGKSLGNKVPIINTREISTTAKIQSGNILVIGGLISEDSGENGQGVPFLMRIPILKYFVGYFNNYSTKIETVIFIKATIVDNGGAMGKKDKKFYDRHVEGSLFKEGKVSKYLPVNDDYSPYSD